MATKTKEKKEKVIDFTKPEKITSEELTKLQTTVTSIDRLTGDIGRIETQKWAMLSAMQKVQIEIDLMRTDFLENYGSDNINIQTGEIAYTEETTEDVKADS